MLSRPHTVTYTDLRRVIESSDDEGGNDSKGKDKAKANGEAPKKRKRYALTPPPELSEEKRAQIHQAVE